MALVVPVVADRSIVRRSLIELCPDLDIFIDDEGKVLLDASDSMEPGNYPESRYCLEEAVAMQETIHVRLGPGFHEEQDLNGHWRRVAHLGSHTYPATGETEEYPGRRSGTGCIEINLDTENDPADWSGFGGDIQGKPGRVPAPVWLVLGHELCGHAVSGFGPETHMAALRAENELRQEHEKGEGRKYGKRDGSDH